MKHFHVIFAGILFLSNISVRAQVWSPANQEAAIANAIEFSDSNGKRVCVMLRPALPADFQAQNLVVYHPRIAHFLCFLELLQLNERGEVQGMIPFGDRSQPAEYWHDITGRVLALIEGIKTDVPPQWDPIVPNQPVAPGSPDPKKPFAARFNHGFAVVDISHEAVQQVRDGTAVVYQIYPNKVTAVGAITGQGLAFYDQLGGGRGVKWIGTTPFGPGMFIPADPKLAAKNIAGMAINPLKQTEFYGKALQDFATSLPQYRQAAQAIGPLNVAVQNLGNLRILNTTPNTAIDRWRNDPARAATNTLGKAGDVRIAGTTPNHAIRSWSQDPKAAAKKTWKSIFGG
jgi:hypothetical protein